MTKIKSLNPKEKQVLEEYSRNGFNISKAVLKSYNCSGIKSASSIGTRIKKKLELVRQQALDSRTQEQVEVQALEQIPKLELDSDINPVSILNRINAIANTDRNGATRLKAMELMGKWAEIRLFREVSEVQSTVTETKSETDLDAEYRALIKSRKESSQVDDKQAIQSKLDATPLIPEDSRE